MIRARRLAIAAAAEVMAADQAGRDTTEWIEKMIRGVVNLCADRLEEFRRAAESGEVLELDAIVQSVRGIADEEV